jgi:hypothetical protein
MGKACRCPNPYIRNVMPGQPLFRENRARPAPRDICPRQDSSGKFAAHLATHEHSRQKTNHAQPV